MGHIPPGAARVGPVRGIVALLRERGVAPEAVFARAGVDIRICDDPDTAIAYRDIGRLAALAAAAARCPHLGLLVGARCAAADLGPVGVFAGHAPDVGTALGDFVKLMALFDRAAVVALTVEGDAASFSYRIVEADMLGAEHLREGSVAIMARLLRHLCGATWVPDMVLFPHRPRGPVLPYRRFFQAPVQFGAATAALVFPARWLSHQPHSADASLRHALGVQIAQLHAAHDGTLAEQVRRAILVAMPQAEAGEAQVAAALGIDRSTLRRRLAREATSFRAIRQEVQYHAAQQLMREADLLLVEVAHMLGYAELAVFTRAFRRWSGMTPSQWRTRHALTAPAPRDDDSDDADA